MMTGRQLESDKWAMCSEKPGAAGVVSASRRLISSLMWCKQHVPILSCGRRTQTTTCRHSTAPAGNTDRRAKTA